MIISGKDFISGKVKTIIKSEVGDMRLIISDFISGLLSWFVCFWKEILFLSFFFFFATQRGLWDLSSSIRDRIQALGSESTES